MTASGAILCPSTVLEPCRKSSYPFLLCYLLFSFAGWLKLVDLETTKEHRSISITRTAILARLGCGLQAINVLLLRGHKQRGSPGAHVVPSAARLILRPGNRQRRAIKPQALSCIWQRNRLPAGMSTPRILTLVAERGGTAHIGETITLAAEQVDCWHEHAIQNHIGSGASGHNHIGSGARCLLA